jgi:CheY-like chemotaxis protein
MGTKILIVDDSATMLRILKTAAKMVILDVVIFEAKNGQEALDLLENNGDIKLILLDINMPVMNGREFLTILRSQEKYNDVKVVIQTTETNKENIAEMVKQGISGYLIKPYKTKTAQDLMIKLAPFVSYEIKVN